ncbi:MAG: hypothetical protein EON55_12315 [Alphaproteobacteria bacterium]|nr:MAG: hypothetical protein EON55_12315 [Alphaproteobacteria bacterium]
MAVPLPSRDPADTAASSACSPMEARTARSIQEITWLCAGATPIGFWGAAVSNAVVVPRIRLRLDQRLKLQRRCGIQGQQRGQGACRIENR